MKKIGLILMVLVIAGIGVINAQQRTITGKVTAAKDGSTLVNVSVLLKNTNISTTTDMHGKYKISVPSRGGILVFSYTGFATKEVHVGKKSVINVAMGADEEEIIMELDVEVEAEDEVALSEVYYKKDSKRLSKAAEMSLGGMMHGITADNFHDFNTEEYDHISENIFLDPFNNPLSTFSIDVDGASYSNLRRFLNNGQMPPKDAVRIEEMVNYFTYDYKDPKGEHPFSIATEVSQAPWNKQHKLVHVGLQGKMVDYEDLKPSNLVFLVDVSGSMSAANKLPLLKSSLKLLLNELGENDRVAVVAYAGAAGLVLPSTPAIEKEKIISALDRLQSGGSTAGGAGIKLAYKVALENIIHGGNNRVILATDGDFNVGVSSTSAMVRMIEEKRKDGIFLTITGFGMGNYKDGRMEQISNAGNGNYFYIDNIKEARKVFVTEMRATLFTIAKDVKIQVEFNPAKVQAYRLLGYENRMLKSEDFNNDKKDAGELGAGHTVTALYEIIPVGVESEFVQSVDELKYQTPKKDAQSHGGELLTVKFRYKQPDGTTSKLITNVLKDNSAKLDKTSNDFRWSAAVAQFGMLLRDSEFKGNASYSDVVAMAEGAKGEDKEGYRAEFIDMVKSFSLLAQK